MNDYFELADALPERPTEPVREVVLQHIRPRPAGVQLDHSVVEHMSDRKIELLVDVLEDVRGQLEEIPNGVFLRISANGDPGNYLESGWLNLITQICVADAKGESKSLDRDVAPIESEDDLEKHIRKRLALALKLARYL